MGKTRERAIVVVVVAVAIWLATACSSADKERCGASRCSDGFKCCPGALVIEGKPHDICTQEGQACVVRSGKSSAAPSSSSGGSGGCDYSGCLRTCTEAGGTNCGEDCKCD
jgi:hypothetical protein